MKDNIEDILQSIGAEGVPNEVHKIAQETSNDFIRSLEQSTQPKHLCLLEHIMKHRMSKLIAAAVLIIAALPLMMFWDRGVTPVYALEQTIEANHTIKTIHLRIAEGDERIENNEFSDCWIKYDDAGLVSNLRCNIYEDGEEHAYAVWNEGILKIWRPSQNIVIVIRVNDMEKYWEHFAREYDPKLIFRWLYVSQENAATQLRIDEPAQDRNSINITATHSTDKTRLELVVDPKTKLVKELVKYHLGEQEDKLDTQIKVMAYNRPIDPPMFRLSGIPEDALVIDQVDQLVGLEQNNLANDEIVVKVVRETLEATIAGDHEKVSQLMEGDSGHTIEKFIEEEFDAKLIRVTSIGEPVPHERSGYHMYVPCEIEVENEVRGKWTENIFAMAELINYQSGRRWIVHRPEKDDGSRVPVNVTMNTQDSTGDTLIVPGERIGEFSLGISKDEVLRSLGKPRTIFLGREKYTLNNLPRRFFMLYSDLAFDIEDDIVKGITAHSPLYTFANGLKVGDSEQRIEQTFGGEFQLEEGASKDFLGYEEKGLYFEIHKEDRTIMEISVAHAKHNQQSDRSSSKDVLNLIRKAASEGRIAYKRTTPGEFKQIVGKPTKEQVSEDGEVVEMEYPGVQVKFFGKPNMNRPIAILWIVCDGESIDIGKDRYQENVETPLVQPFDEMRTNDLSKSDRSSSRDVLNLIRKAASEGRIAYKRTTPEEFKRIVGKPTKERIVEGGEVVEMEYPGVQVKFFGKPNINRPVTIIWIAYEDGNIDIGKDRYQENVKTPSVQPFDKERGKNPGLGVRRLHEKGITGRGVRVAILDQVLLVDHQEYAERLRFYEKIELPDWLGPQMHGPAVASIAVGKTVGVAPEAELYYVAKKGGPRYVAQGIDRILKVNEQLPKNNKIRVISISVGWTPSTSSYEDNMAACERAKDAGIFVVSCALEEVYGFNFHGLGRDPSADPDVFESYEPGHWWAKDYYDGARWQESDRLLIPMDSRTTASPNGKDKYIFHREGGWSWSVPYIAGVYALAVQVEPDITPEKFWNLALKTGRTIQLEHEGTKRPFGLIIDPVKLIGSISKDETVSQRASSKHTIVPGVGVGDYKLGMSKNEVETLSRSGKPESMHFVMSDGIVKDISVYSPLYQFVDGFGVGDSEKKIQPVFGYDYRFDEYETKDLLTYKSKGLQFKIHKKSGTIEEITVFPPKGRTKLGSRDELMAYASIRGKDLSACDLRYAGDILDTLQFNQGTVWPSSERLPKGFDPNVLFETSKNPGLGVRGLHAQGITGAGVHVGLIDQPLLPGHPEYADKIVSYHVIDCGRHKSSMHGPAMTSLLVGRHCGTAPCARLHVVAVPSWKRDAGYYARALDRFVAYNESAPKEEKIRIVSVSCQPSGEGSNYKNQALWDQAMKRAQVQGILVLDCTWHHGFVSLCWLDPKDRESVEACTPGFRNGLVKVDEDDIHVPSAPRTWATAHANSGRPFGYTYFGGCDRSKKPKTKNGYSPTIPYVAGILALGWQINPDLTPTQMKELLFESAYIHESGAKIIHPKAFINVVRKHPGDPQHTQAQKISATKRSKKPPGPITFPKIDRRPAGGDFGRAALESMPRYDPKGTENWQVDLRGHDVSRFDLRKSLDDLLYADFDSRTTWPTPDRMPEGFDRERIMKLGKNPGLGVHKVHERGITGRGIGIAIVDQPLLTGHQEYADRLRFYEEINVRPDSEAAMHGAAVASIALGKTVGVAPEADLYYIGSWTGDWGKKGKDRFKWNFAYYAQAVRRILEINEQLPDERKIRVISMSIGWNSKRKGYDEMTAAVEEAKKAGMLVVCSCIDDVHGFVFDGLGRAPMADPDDFPSYEPGGWLAKSFYQGRRKWNQLWVPMDSRTTAAPNGVDEYVFYRQGGWSWAIPYVAGVYALAVQVEPDITPERFWSLAMQTGRTINLDYKGQKIPLGPIIDPVELITTLQKN